MIISSEDNSKYRTAIFDTSFFRIGLYNSSEKDVSARGLNYPNQEIMRKNLFDLKKQLSLLSFYRNPVIIGEVVKEFNLGYRVLSRLVNKIGKNKERLSRENKRWFGAGTFHYSQDFSKSDSLTIREREERMKYLSSCLSIAKTIKKKINGKDIRSSFNAREGWNYSGLYNLTKLLWEILEDKPERRGNTSEAMDFPIEKPGDRMITDAKIVATAFTLRFSESVKIFSRDAGMKKLVERVNHAISDLSLLKAYGIEHVGGVVCFEYLKPEERIIVPSLDELCV